MTTYHTALPSSLPHFIFKFLIKIRLFYRDWFKSISLERWTMLSLCQHYNFCFEQVYSNTTSGYQPIALLKYVTFSSGQTWMWLLFSLLLCNLAQSFHSASTFHSNGVMTVSTYRTVRIKWLNERKEIVYRIKPIPDMQKALHSCQQPWVFIIA